MGVIAKEIKLEGSLGEADVKALFDSGASMSFIKKSLAKKLEVILKLKRPLKFETAEKGRELVVDKRIIVDFYLNGERLSDEFLVLEDELATEDVIVGASTFQKWRLVLDFEKEDVYSIRKVKKHMLK